MRLPDDNMEDSGREGMFVMRRQARFFFFYTNKKKWRKMLSFST